MEPTKVETKRVKAPYIETAGGIVYQITLSSGQILTGPSDFPRSPELPSTDRVIVTEDGRVIVMPRPSDEATPRP